MSTATHPTSRWIFDDGSRCFRTSPAAESGQLLLVAFPAERTPPFVEVMGRAVQWASEHLGKRGTALQQTLDMSLISGFVKPREECPPIELRAFKSRAPSQAVAEKRFADANQVLALRVRCPREGPWRAPVIIHTVLLAVQASLRGIAVEPHTGRLLNHLIDREGDTAWNRACPPGIDSGLYIPTIDLVGVIQSFGEHPRLGQQSTDGMALFGLPEFWTKNVPPRLMPVSFDILAAVAMRVLLTSTLEAHPSGEPAYSLTFPERLTLNSRDVFGAIGRPQPEPPGDGYSLSIQLTGELRRPNPVWIRPVLADTATADSPFQNEDWYSSVWNCSAWYDAACRFKGLDLTPKTFQIRSDNSDVAAAVQSVRESTQGLRERFCSGLPSDRTMFIKHPLPDASGDRDSLEYVWSEVIDWQDGDVLALLSCQPLAIEKLEVGAALKLREDLITDFMVGPLLRQSGPAEGDLVGSVIREKVFN